MAQARFVRCSQALTARTVRHSAKQQAVACRRCVHVRCQRPDLAGEWREGADEWGEYADEEDASEYFDTSFSSTGYEAAATALTLAAGAALLKLLWYLAIVCWAMVITAFQYSVVAIALIVLVVFLG